MGLFNRFKKAEEETISEAPPVKKPEEIEKERLQNELDNLKKEVGGKTESFDSISNKLEKVREEYDSVIAKVMPERLFFCQCLQ